MRFIVVVMMFLLISAGPAFAQLAPPVDSQSISLGSWGGAVLEWLLVLIAPTLATLVSMVLYKALTWLGVQVDQTQRDKLQDIVVNGVNLFGHQLAGKLQGRSLIQVHDELALSVLSYVKDHGKEVINSLGLDVDDPKLPQVISARVARALSDPMAPTPPELTPPEVQDMVRTRQQSSTGTDGVEQRQPVDVVSNHVIYGHQPHS
jgi:hypothetical protein